MSWESKFQSHTTSVAFQLQLSRRMVQALMIVKSYNDGKGGWPYSLDFSHSVTSMRCLLTRGLAEHHDKPADFKSWDKCKQWEFEHGHRYWTLTPAGELTFKLCQLAGLIPNDVAANEEVA